MHDRADTIATSRHCHRSRDRVFRAFGELHQLEAWYAPGPDWKVAVDFVDFRVGGHYRLHFGPADESVVYTEEGIYREIEPPVRIGIDVHLSVSGRAIASTHCRFDLREAHDGTELYLEETGCPAALRATRSVGWEHAIDRLVRHLMRGE